MSRNAVLSAEARAQQEKTFLEALQARPIPVDTLVAGLKFLTAAGETEAAEASTQMLESTLIETGDRDGLIRLLRFRSADRENDRAFGILCRDALLKAWKDRDAGVYLETAGFGECPASESFRRLDLLLACKPGVLCLDTTWGIGVVKRLDTFYRKVTFDFPGKPGHALSFASVVETLTLVDEKHILSRHHVNPSEIARLVSEKPDEIVRMALRSFGSLSVVRLEQMLVSHKIIAAGAWKGFWDSARKALKTDPLVEIPSKRSNPIQLHAQARDFNEAWLDAFSGERDLRQIVAGVEAFFDASNGVISDAARAILTDRLAFAIKGARNTDPALYAHLTSVSVRTGIEAVPLAEMREHLWEQQRYIQAAEHMIARDVGSLVRVLITDPTGPARLLGTLCAMPFSLLSETLDALREGEHLEAAQQRCRELLLAPKAPPTLIVWVFRNRNALSGWPIPGLAELLAHGILLVEQKLVGESLRMQNQMRSMFEHAKWFENVLGELDEAGRCALFDRLQASTAFDPTTQRALLGRMLKYDPALVGRKRSSDPHASAPRTSGHFTSWRSLAERQAQYKRLIEIDLPKSSQDIAVARSYGDLRENFEYQAAKQAQSLLLQRQSEMDLELKQTKGTDFANAPIDRAGMGVTVTLAHADGRIKRFSILGEWDRDEALGIISCKSRMAQCLEGCRVGDEIRIPGETGEESVTIQAVEALDDAVRAWVNAVL